MGLLLIAAGICFGFILTNQVRNALLANQSEEGTSFQFQVVDIPHGPIAL